MAEDRKKTNIVVACGRPMSVSQLLKDSKGFPQGKLIDVKEMGLGFYETKDRGYTGSALWAKNRPTKRERS